MNAKAAFFTSNAIVSCELFIFGILRLTLTNVFDVLNRAIPTEYGT